MDNNILSVSNLSAGYGKAKIVDDVTFDIKPGEIFGLIGLNGVGKTTLIKTILGLRDPISGEINHKGKENISFLPERFDPPWFLSGYQFLKFSQKLYKKDISISEAQDLAQSISLDPASLKHDVRTYSKGMRQKLGLLSAIVSECQLLILDEPMSGLDPKARGEVKKLIHGAKQKGRSILMSSHILADMHELCDRVAVLHDGKIIFTGTPTQMEKAGGDKSLEGAFLNLIDDTEEKVA